MSRAHAVAEPAALDWSGAPRSRLPTGWEPAMLLVLSSLLLLFGIVSVYSASSVLAQTEREPDWYYVVRQVTGAAVGFVLLLAAAFVDYRRLRLLAWPMMLGTIGMLVATLFVGNVVNGAQRWLAIGPVSVQPSEFAKLALIIWTAALAVKKQDKLNSLSRGLLPFLLVWLLVMALIFLQPNASAAVLVVLLAALVVFAAGARIGHFILLGIVGVPFLWSQIQAAPYRLRRLEVFLDPNLDPGGSGYQIKQAMIAVGSGGVFGRGFGHGVQ